MIQTLIFELVEKIHKLKAYFVQGKSEIWNKL